MKVSVVLDGVPVTIDSPWWPEERPVLVPSPPGSAIQAATSSRAAPAFGQVTLVAVPFKTASPSELPGVLAGPDAVPAFRSRLRETRNRQQPKRLTVLPVELFGHRVDGDAGIIELRLDDDGPARVAIAEWVVQAGPRLWILRIARASDRDAVPDDDALQRFVASLAAVRIGADPTALNQHPSTLLLAPELQDTAGTSGVGGPAPVLSGFGAGAPGVPSLPAPAWWQGAFDDGHYFPQAGKHSGPLGANLAGLVACGPRPIAGGPDVVVGFFPGAHGEFEWECVELSMRWLYQAYGIAPYPANGNQVVPNYPGGGGLVVVWNGTAQRPPTPGDVLSLGPADPFGHTAVVMDAAVDPATGNGTIAIIEQNSSLQGKQTLSVVAWSVKAWLPVSGWLHLPGSASTPATAMAFIWSGVPFDPAFAIPQAWLAQLQAGHYMGRPLGGEIPIPAGPAGAVFQVFEHGLATFVPGQAQASFTGAGLSDAQLASIAQTGLFWGTTLPFDATFAVPRAWLAALRGGTYAGRPLSGEVPIPGGPAGAVFQVFEQGLATFLPGQAQASFTGAGLTDAQLADSAALSYVWGNVQLVAEFAIPQAWLAALKAGNYVGRPVSAELPMPNAPAGAAFQVFEQGLATFLPGQAQASFTGAGLTDAQLAAVAQSASVWGSVPFVPGFALPQAWLAQWQGGHYVGQPVSVEVPNPSAGPGSVFQLFGFGLATYRPGSGVGWMG